MKTLRKYFSSVQFRILGGFIIGPLILFGGSIAWYVIQHKPAPDYYGLYLVSIASLCIAISSAFIIKYKEAPRPGLQNIKGTWAVAQGIVALVISGSACIILLFDATAKLLR